MSRPRRIRLDARAAGAMLCATGFGLLAHPSLFATAIGIELLAAGFWCWARVSDDAAAQVPRWGWLRRPAAALWLAAAIHTVAPGVTHSPAIEREALGPLLSLLESAAIVWAGLELMAALPLARPYSDLPGPFLKMRPWLPVLLPSAGFLVLWRHDNHWSSVAAVRDTAGLLLILTAMLGGLRALARRSWTASLRWAIVVDSALAGLLLATRTVSANASLLLWIATACGHALLLAGELRSAVTRRGPVNAALWRFASWMAIASLSWPIFAGPRPSTLVTFYVPLATVPVALMAWIGVRRLALAPERRRLVRASLTSVASQLAAGVIAVLGPLGLALAWWAGYEPSWRASVPALVPAAAGGAAAWASRHLPALPLWRRIEAIGGYIPEIAGHAYVWFVALERRLMGLLGRIAGAAAAALHGLHTGDAQEYLLFLIGVTVLALLIPLLQ